MTKILITICLFMVSAMAFADEQSPSIEAHCLIIEAKQDCPECDEYWEYADTSRKCVSQRREVRTYSDHINPNSVLNWWHTKRNM